MGKDTPKLSLVVYPASILRKQATIVKTVDGPLIKAADAMFSIMYENHGVGLAAPQVGMSKRVLVIDLRQDDQPIYVMINPRITKREGETEAEEGCLSLPEVFGQVKRAERVEVAYVDREGEERTLLAEGLLARAIQHEIDHLNGVLFADRVAEAQKKLVDQKLRELAESAKQKSKEHAR
ncbi:peptide deformylase [Candidatus Poribacteria bacterium]|nr:peptide deformylase [Candidatus Poribacteria bacterium]